MSDNKAVVLASGGIDSAVCMASAANTYDEIIPVHFDYGQQTRNLEQEMAIRQKLHLEDEYEGTTFDRMHLVDYREVFSHFAQGVANPDKDFDHMVEDDGRSAGYVPVRNLHLIATGAAFADVHDAEQVYHGAQGGDEADYPDCRPEFMHKAAGAISRSVPDGQELNLRTPLINLDKHEVIQYGEELGVDWTATYSCYEETSPKDPEPCGACPACEERVAAFEEAGLTDPFAPEDNDE